MLTPESSNDRHDLASHLTARVESAVAAIRDRSVRPVQAAAHWIVLGVAFTFVALFAVIAIGVGVVRLLDDDVFGHRVWATDLLFGGILVAGGVFLMRQGGSNKGNGSD